MTGEPATEAPVNGGRNYNGSAQSFMENVALCGAPHLEVLPCETKNHKKSKNNKLIYILPPVISSVFILGLVYGITILRTKHIQEPIVESGMSPVLGTARRFSYLELQQATNGFSTSNVTGSGGFSIVYRGILASGKHVEVKVSNLQLEGAFKTFDDECEMLCNIRHRNLAQIVGSCNNIDFKALVLTHMPNGSLEKWLHSQNYCPNMMQRMNIMIDVAAALEYLHHGYLTLILHCDLKPSNILLDEDMVAHLADFGISKFLGGGDSITQTMTLATIGYMSPEYGLEVAISRRSDVNSYGIFLMEAFTGKKPTDETFLGELSMKP